MIRLTASLATFTLVAPLLAQDFATSPRPAKPGSVTRPQKALPETFGTLRVSYVQIPPNAFQPYHSGQTYTSDEFGLGPRWATAGNKDLVAPVHLPTGAKVVYLELNYVDTSATQAVLGAFVECTFQGQNCVPYPTAGAGPADCALPGFICSGEAANAGLGSRSADLSGEGITVDNFLNEYTVIAEPTAFDGSVKIAGMIVGYVLQVSPAPVLPSFNDVPPGDFGFQYIEALAFSGITGGCQAAPPLFCPDSPVTRRQMAIFLAKALGLQWPYQIF